MGIKSWVLTYYISDIRHPSGHVDLVVKNEISIEFWDDINLGISN